MSKGKLWCADFPTVTVPRQTEPRPLTLIYPYYTCPQFFHSQQEHWRSLPAALRAHLSAVVVDDGSPVPARLDEPQAFPGAMRLYRIEIDVRWNWLAARNIGAHHAADGWLLLTDMDHLVPEPTLETCVYGALDARKVYSFSRREHTGQTITPHSASWLMTRKMFWGIGGYDETYSGWYGTDGLFRRRVAHYARIEVLTDFLIRYEYVLDSSTTRYKRKQPEDARKPVVAKGHKPKVLSFPYHEVLTFAEARLRAVDALYAAEERRCLASEAEARLNG